MNKLDVFLKGDIGNRAARGAGGAEREPAQMKGPAFCVNVNSEGDATREQLDEIVQHATHYSPVANSMRNPIAFVSSLKED
ncbi:MAG TPA: hypothetical protein VKZ94_17270 [Advenella sp.]|nr:hypothetical protein [Advenella sp.]